jgi:alpha-methylacyl-CoA racemase
MTMGPLQGIRIVEFAGIGPGPFCGMVLADLGADVLVVDRKVPNANTRDVSFFNLGRFALLNRGKRMVALDLKRSAGVDAALRMIGAADALIEGFRPGVMERNGLGPDVCLARNPRLVYGRMTGWGQTGPLANAAGHDVNYLALSGALALGAPPGGHPWAPPTLVGDMGGGGLVLALGIVSAILEARTSGKGQVVDAAITDGSALLTTIFHAFKAAGVWQGPGHPHVLDSSAPFYGTFHCNDGKWISIGALEPQFYALLVDKCGLADDPTFAKQWNGAAWPRMKQRIAALIATRTREEWCRLLEGTDVCFAPVLDPDEAAAHPHNRARSTFVDVDGVTQPAPAPRFSRTPAELRSPPPPPGQPDDAALADWGIAPEEIAALRAAGALA